jgi:hypothetical protein
MATLIRSWRATTISNLAYKSSDAGAHPETDQAPICPAFIPNSADSNRQGTVLASHRSIDRHKNFGEGELRDESTSVHVISRHQLWHCRHWQSAFASQHKDHRYYEIVEDTIHPEFDYLYLAIRDRQGESRAIQPFFILDLDILVGVCPYFGQLIDSIRLLWRKRQRLSSLARKKAQA